MEYLTTNQIEKEFEKLMLERKRYLINEDLEKARENYNFPKLKYATFKPDTVGIMTRIENEIKFIVYKNDSIGALELQEEYNDFASALNRSRQLYNELKHQEESKLVMKYNIKQKTLKN